jgi:nucleotide-binding universal stress UspA family protein
VSEDAETMRAHREEFQTAADRIVGQARQMLMESGVSERFIQVKTVEEDDPSRAIVREAQGGEYDMVAMGRKGRSAVQEFLVGSVTDRVVRHCDSCTVLVVE